jgi:hypothetical protein
MTFAGGQLVDGLAVEEGAVADPELLAVAEALPQLEEAVFFFGRRLVVLVAF